MAPHKCNYIIFSNKNISKNSLNIKLYNVKLDKSKNPTFLGLRFDAGMNFNNQINYIIERCYSRLNCIKILSQKNFKLTKDTLVQIYIALVRSVMEYSSIIISRLSN
jgi:hypothetical protein